MIGNFKNGDVVVKIGGRTAYVVDGTRSNSIWYGVKYLWWDKVVEADIHRFSLDADYVRVDRCVPSDDRDVHDKLIRIAKAFGRTGNQ